MRSDQAANELTEDQVLNFLVNTLDEEIDIELGVELPGPGLAAPGGHALRDLGVQTANVPGLLTLGRVPH